MRYTSDSPILPHLPPSAPRSLSKSKLMDRFAFAWVGLTQMVFANTFFMCTTGTLSPSTVGGHFYWAGPARLVDPLVLTNQVAFAKWNEYPSGLKPTPSALSVVLTVHCNLPFSRRLVHGRGCDTLTQCHALWPRSLWGCYRNESRCPTWFFLGCHVSTALAFQGPA